FEPGRVWHATRTPEGPATLVVQAARAPETARARAWGPGAAWTVREAPRFLGVDDDPDSFEPAAGSERGTRTLRQLRDAHRGLRLGVATSLFEVLLTVVYQQRVTWKDATFAHAEMIRRYGEPAPGPAGLRLPPPPERLATLGYADFHPAGVERKRAETIRRCARLAERLEALRDATHADAAERLRALPGIGPWTVGMVMGLGLGDPDAVAEGDYHLPNVIAWVMEGVARSDDERMLELLAPYAGQRWRVVRLLMAGNVGAPRFGPRMSRSRWAQEGH
ncbi:MAG: DNA-3-methyladenine glycosylase 2 family protein, partial [Myxococcota bacterium]